MKQILRITKSILFCIAFLFTSVGFAQSELPTLGNTSSSLISIQQEKVLGTAWLRSLRRQVKTYNNPVVAEYFSNLVYKLAPNSEVIDRQFSLVMLNNASLNAFAVPGSIIGIHAGLFIHAPTEQEFASVIAHELAHLSQRHYARKLEKDKQSTPLNLAGLLASVIITATAGSEAGVAALATTQAASIDQQLRFSRLNEQEADRIAIDTMHNSGFDPRAMPALFEKMMRNNRLQGSDIPEYLSTHPLSENRISDTRNRAEQFEHGRYQDSLDFHIARNIILTDFSESKQKAADFFKSILDKGNSQKLSAEQFGLGYALLESEPERSAEIFKALLDTYPDLISAHIYYALSLHMMRQSDLGIQHLNKTLERNPNNYAVIDMLAHLYLETHQLKQSQGLLKQLSRSHKDNPQVWYKLAEAEGLIGNIPALHIARAEYFYLHNRLDDGIEQLKLARKKSQSNQQQALIKKRIGELIYLKKNPPF